MKPGRKKPERKPEHDETSMESPGSDTVGSDNRNNPDGIDGIRALMILGGGIGILLLVWFILTYILHVI